MSIQSKGFSVGRDIFGHVARSPDSPVLRRTGEGGKPVTTGAATGVKALAAAHASASGGGDRPAPTPITTGALTGVKTVAAGHTGAIEEHTAPPASTATPTTLEGVAAMDQKAIDRYPTGKNSGAGSPLAKPILKYAFGSNWFFAKDVLIYNRWPDSVPADLPLRRPENAAQREDLMWRLIGLRTWEYNDIFKRLRDGYEKDGAISKGKTGAAVLDWGSAGSDTATSDVDINLKGEANMRAVADFNKNFLAGGWPYEAGTVYDVNAYCKDNMWDFGVNNETGLMTPTSEPNAPESLPKDETDANQQDVASMIKLIRFLSHGHELPLRIPADNRWAMYKAKLTMTPALTTKIVTAETGYRKWFTELELEKAAVARGAEAVIDSTLMAADHAKKLTDAIDIRASNRLYEKKIKQLIAARQELADANAAHVPAAAVLGIARRVRQIVLEAGMFANEAMITAGASQFVVFGTQVGLKKEKAIGKSVTFTLTEAQFFHAFTEQLADTIKEFTHFDRLDDGLLKGGKYLMRMTLAADQLDGVKGNQAQIANMAKLRKLGDYAMTAKNMTRSVEDKQKIMGLALTESGLPAAKKEFLEVIAQFGADVTNAYNAAKEGVAVPAQPAADDPLKVEKDKVIADAMAKKIGAEMRIAEIKGADLTSAIAALELGALPVGPGGPAPEPDPVSV
jgi:hypothetical protein